MNSFELTEGQMETAVGVLKMGAEVVYVGTCLGVMTAVVQRRYKGKFDGVEIVCTPDKMAMAQFIRATKKEFRPHLNTVTNVFEDVDCHCQKCGNLWHPRKYRGDVAPRRPSCCPQCKSPTWESTYVDYSV